MVKETVELKRPREVHVRTLDTAGRDRSPRPEVHLGGPRWCCSAGALAGLREGHGRHCDPTPLSPSGLGRIRWRPGGYLIVSTASPVALPSLRLWVGPELPRLQTPRLSPVAVGKFVEPRPLASNRVLKQAVYPPALWSGAGAAATRTTAKLCCRCAARPGSTVPRPWTTFRRSARINAGEL